MLFPTLCQAQQAINPQSTPSRIYKTVYQETYRPQFHFSAKQGWLNDPNGLVYFDGEYHLFFQFEELLSGDDPKKSWGHAVSMDLVHWHQLADALEPDALGPMWSGSAVVDWDNTSGFGSPGKPPLVAVYTAAGGQSPASQGHDFTQCLAYSTDRGRTWTKYAKNPVLPHIAGENRDPKVVWYAPTRHWIMALYLDGDQFGLFSSPDLKTWTQTETLRMPGSGECPDFFPLPIAGTKEQRWVFTAANDAYLVGIFDGTKFVPETPVLPGDAGTSFYAAQTFSDIPARDGRRIQIAWMRGGDYPNMPFNQQMSFPCALTLHATPDGPRLFRWPVKEIATLYGKAIQQHNITLQPGADRAVPVPTGELWDIEAEFAPSPGATAFGLRVRGTDIRYQTASGGTLSSLGRQVSLTPEPNGRVTLRLLLDRTSLEVFGNGGQVSLTSCFLPASGSMGLSVYTEGGAATLVSLTAHPLHSAWPSSSAK
jgi:fructan beta-fructosidase